MTTATSRRPVPTIVADNGVDFAQFRAGRFTWTVEGPAFGRLATIVVTRDDRYSVTTIASYDYWRFDSAAEAAWRMAMREMAR